MNAPVRFQALDACVTANKRAVKTLGLLLDGFVQQQSLGLCHGSWEKGHCNETHWGSGHGRKIPRGPSNGFDPDIGQRCPREEMKMFNALVDTDHQRSRHWWENGRIIARADQGPTVAG